MPKAHPAITNHCPSHHPTPYALRSRNVSARLPGRLARIRFAGKKRRFLGPRFVRIYSHLRINDGWGHNRVGMRHRFRLFDNAGIVRTGWDLRRRNVR
jgi:hypothetical protein